MSLDKSFFARDTETVARDLLGSIIEKDGIRARIVETEAYLKDDPASHAYPKKTERNRLMYETYGNLYIYICYGIHRMLNFTTEKEGVGGVLVRAVEPLEGLEEIKENREMEKIEKLTSGPGKLCEAMEIDRKLNGQEIGNSIKLEYGKEVRIEKSGRIGISKAKDRELRFFVSENPYVSV